MALCLVAAACGSSDAPPAAAIDASAEETPSPAVSAPPSDRAPVVDAGAKPFPHAGPSDAGSSDAAPGDAAAIPPPPTPRRYLCINGAGVNGPGGRESGGNGWLEQYCATFGAELIQDCVEGPCFSTFEFEVMTNPSRTTLVGALDTNLDGRVTAADTRFDLVLIGYSWGGTNVRDLAAWMQTDASFDDARRGVSVMVALDAYRPGASMDVPGNVAKFLSLRHSAAPPGDCSFLTVGGFVLSGPYLGLVPRCKASSQCIDYDYTLGGDTFFPGAFTPGGGYYGSGVDHCGIVNAAVSALPSLLSNKVFSPLPPTVPVAAY
jgi:hypothetical protein